MASGLENPGTLDAFAHDTRTDRVVLAMFETREWTGGELQGFQLQEKLNAYVSFILDGEMAEQFPQLVGKRVCIQLRTVHEPDARTLAFLAQVREQLAFQEIDFETVLIGEGEVPPPGGGCGCGNPGGCCSD